MGRGKVIVYSRRPAVGGMVAAALCGEGTRVVRCDSPDDTVAACLRERPDLVIILSVAPFVDGSEFIRRIRRRGARRPAVYVMSWHQSEHIVLSLLESGVDQYLTFPVCMSRLDAKVRRQLDSDPEA